MRASRTDAAAFDELYLRSAPPIWQYLRRRTRDDDAATELMAETFARAWNRRAHFAAESPDALPWLYGIARNVILESVRRARLERGATESLGIDLMLRRGPSDVLPDESWLDGLDDALNDLPDGQRSAIALRYTDDLSYDEIARRLGTSAVGARTRVSRGVDALRRHFQAL